MARTLWGLIALCVLAWLLPFGVARADYATPSLAYSACQSYLAGNFPTGTGKQCLDDPANKKIAAWANGYLQQYFIYASALSCSGTSAQTGAFSGKLGAGSPMCQGITDKQGCAMTFAPDDKAFLNRDGTKWATHGTYTPSGGTCTPTVVGPGVASAAARSCGGGSCFDSAAHQYCAVDGSGAQVCVPSSTAQASPGACVSSGNTTVCAGTPSAPVPPSPPVSPISDPATEIKGTDRYTTSDGSSSNTTTTVNTYGAGSSKPTSGKATGDDGDPANSGDGTSAGGGGDCNSPPVVGGSPALGMIARQTWLLRCADAGQGSDDSDTSVPGLDDVGTTPGDGFSKEVTVLDKLDVSGFGAGTECPKLPDLDLGSLGHYSLNSDWWCDLLSKTGYMIMMLATWFALRILGEK